MHTEEKASEFEGWAILELMGHRKLGGYVREAKLAGAGVIRIDVPAKDGEGNVSTQFYSPSAMYCMTPVAEEVARRFAAAVQPEPVTRWELPALPKPSEPEEAEIEEEEELGCDGQPGTGPCCDFVGEDKSDKFKCPKACTCHEPALS